MSEIKVGQTWVDNGGYSLTVEDVDYGSEEVEVQYSDEELEWITFDDLRDDWDLEEEGVGATTPSNSIEDAEAAFKASQTAELSDEPKYVPASVAVKEAEQDAFARAEALFNGEKPISALDQADENFKKSVDYPLAQVESPKISAKNAEYAKLLVLGII